MNRAEQLRHAVEVLASSPDRQLEYLRSIGLFSGVPQDKELDQNIDEIGLQFGDIACTRNSMASSGEISVEQRDAVDNLHEIILSYSGQQNADLWTVEALRQDQRWEIVRKKAQLCLSLFSAGAA